MSALHYSDYPARASQRGAVTVILVVLLLLVVGTALSGVVRLSGSGATDATAQEDGIAALLLAESGMERASKRFADGTACTTDALKEGPVSLARGSFSIISAAFDNNICRIRAQGKVGSALRTIEGDATTVMYEPFPPEYSDSKVFDKAWPETVLKCCKDGKSFYDQTNSATADASGSMAMETDLGNNKKFEGWRQRTLPANITGEQVVTLNLAYKMDHTGAQPKDQNLKIYLIDTAAGKDYLVTGADFNGPTSPQNVWITSPTLSYTIPAGAVIDRIRIYFKLTNGKGKGKGKEPQTFIWADNVRLTTSAAAYPLRNWTEIVQ